MMPSYFMGVDEGGYDKRTYSMVTMDSDKNIVAHYYGHDKAEFDKQVAQTSECYGIPSENIIYEIN